VFFYFSLSFFFPSSLVCDFFLVFSSFRHPGKQAHGIWVRVVTHITRVLPRYSDEKIVYFDELAQVRIMAGNVKGAKEAYTHALEISRVSCGVDTPQTLQLQGLVAHFFNVSLVLLSFR
jgi:hypothetical protein